MDAAPSQPAFCHPGLWPLSATSSLSPAPASGHYSSLASARSTGCIISALAAGSVKGRHAPPLIVTDSSLLLHPAISNTNLSSRLRPREVRGRGGDVFQHPAVVSPGSVGALAKEEIGAIGFGAIEADEARKLQQAEEDDLKGATWCDTKTGKSEGSGPKLER